MAILKRLSRLFRKQDYQTDKVSNGLVSEYGIAFRHLLNQPVTLLEIGLYRGDSLRFWDDLFPNPKARIIGVDRRIPEVKGTSRIITRECDQNDTAGLQ